MVLQPFGKLASRCHARTKHGAGVTAKMSKLEGDSAQGAGTLAIGADRLARGRPSTGEILSACFDVG